jgi:uncharacterized protein
MTAEPKVLHDAARLETDRLADWGALPATASHPGRVSRTRGRLLYKGENGAPETGLWECTPGVWECRVTRDEFCHFLSGRSIYTDAAGRRIEIGAGDSAFFPAGWTGTCEVLETVRKVYMIR